MALVSIGVLAAIMAFAITVRFSSHNAMSPVADPFTIWTAVAGAVGGICGFLSCYHKWLGFAGTSGWIRAGIGGLIISGIAAVVAGTLILPYWGTMFAPFQLIIAMIEQPMLAIVWVGILISAHKLLEPWRRERDSIFASARPSR